MVRIDVSADPHTRKKKKIDTVPKWPELKKERLRSIVIAFFSSGHLGMA
jgi:hypothetical protein